MVEILDLVDAMVDALNEGSFPTSFTARRNLFMRQQVKDINALTVSVFAGPESQELASRGGKWLRTYDVHVGVYAPLQSDASEDIARHLQITSEIKDQVGVLALNGIPCSEIEQDEPFDVDAVQERALFAAVITFRYKKVA